MPHPIWGMPHQSLVMEFSSRGPLLWTGEIRGPMGSPTLTVSIRSTPCLSKLSDNQQQPLPIKAGEILDRFIHVQGSLVLVRNAARLAVFES